MNHILLILVGTIIFPIRRAPSFIVAGIGIMLIAYALVFGSHSWDYEGYLRYFDCVRWDNCSAENSQIEVSFVLASSILAAIFDDAGGPLVIVLYAAIAVSIKLHVMRRESVAFGVALLGYLCLGWFLHELTQIRVGLGIAFLWLATHHYCHGSKRRSAVYFGLAILSHYSLIMGVTFLLLAKVKIDLKRWFFLISLALLFGEGLLNLSGPMLELAGTFIDPRLGVYASAIGSKFLTPPQISVHSGLTIIMITLCLWQGIQEWSRFEIAALKFVILGVTIYSLLFWLPIVGLRLFEMLTSFLPFVGAAGFRSTKSTAVKIALILVFLCIFFNTVVRNGLMLDFVIPGQAQEAAINALE